MTNSFSAKCVFVMLGFYSKLPINQLLNFVQANQTYEFEVSPPESRFWRGVWRLRLWTCTAPWLYIEPILCGFVPPLACPVIMPLSLLVHYLCTFY